ncbi:TIGR04140 family protein [Palaeococcus ferrophilus]|uniref:TIGR04140 family protein n=1 Tax=Palaeococcus ferrophilus TaxID=83868 RepID=UPI00064F21B1|nr:TIGR04140 family protein [Palaeococcus ferrophilus]
MEKTLITAVPPGEVLEILRRSKAGINIEIREGEPFRGMPRWKLRITGEKGEIERFMEFFMRARAGG